MVRLSPANGRLYAFPAREGRITTRTYKDAGVDIDAGASLVETIKPMAEATTRPGVIGGLGNFGGLFSGGGGWELSWLEANAVGDEEFWVELELRHRARLRLKNDDDAFARAISTLREVTDSFVDSDLRSQKLGDSQSSHGGR